MCLICVHFEQDKLTNQEAWNNLSEMRDKLDVDHYKEVKQMLLDADIEELNRQLRSVFGSDYEDYEDLDAFDFDNLEIGFGD